MSTLPRVSLFMETRLRSMILEVVHNLLNHNHDTYQLETDDNEAFVDFYKWKVRGLHDVGGGKIILTIEISDKEGRGKE